MAKTFVIIDDTGESHLALTRAIDARKESSDKVVSIWPTHSGPVSVAHQSLEVSSFENMLQALGGITGDKIVFLDVKFPPVHEMSDFQAGSPVASGYAALTSEAGPRVVMLTHSKESQPDKVREGIRAACTTDGQRRCLEYSRSGGLDARFGDRDVAAAQIVDEALALYAGNALERLWRHSMVDYSWFGEPEEGRALLHAPEDAWNRRNTALCASQKTELYDSVVSEAFGVPLPSEWFSTQNAFTNFHQNLKTLCGAHYRGLIEDGRYNLSVGAVFLIAGMAYHSVRSDRGLGPFGSTGWQNATNSTAPFLLLQPREIAQETALAFFHLFERMFARERKIVDGQYTEWSEVNATEWDEGQSGRNFTVWFNWSGAKAFERPILRRFNPLDEWTVPARNRAATTTDWLIRLFSCINVQSDGFGHPGRIYMTGDALHVRGEA